MTETKDLQLDLRKQLVIDLKKKVGLDGVVSRVMCAIDYSGSMSSLYSNGTVQSTVERVLPVAMGFDDDGEVDMFYFHNLCMTIKPTLNVGNYKTYVKDNFTGGMGGTNYAPVLYAIMEKLGIKPSNVEKKGFFSKLFNSDKQKSVEKFDSPVYVIVITDGECYDKEETEKALIDASQYGIFFQFVGIGNESFYFLKQLDSLKGRVIDNANFFSVKDLNTISDEQLYSLLMSEYPSWIKEAKQKNII